MPTLQEQRRAKKEAIQARLLRKLGDHTDDAKAEATVASVAADQPGDSAAEAAAEPIAADEASTVAPKPIKPARKPQLPAFPLHNAPKLPVKTPPRDAPTGAVNHNAPVKNSNAGYNPFVGLFDRKVHGGILRKR